MDLFKIELFFNMYTIKMFVIVKGLSFANTDITMPLKMQYIKQLYFPVKFE